MEPVTDQTTTRDCIACGSPICAERLYFLPRTCYCTNCVDKYGLKVVHDANELCAKASQSCQNGFAPNG